MGQMALSSRHGASMRLSALSSGYASFLLYVLLYFKFFVLLL